MKRLILGLWISFGLLASPQTGSVTAPERSGIGVFRVQCAGTLAPGDIVAVSRGAQKLGEATVLRVTPGGAVITLRGVYDARVGDSIAFLRHPAGQASSASGAPVASNEYRIAERSLAKALRMFPESRDTKSAARVKRIGEKLAKASGRNIPWNFYLVEADEPNAFTIGEGFVFVTEPLLALGLTDDELAGVLAHEICHGTERHTLRESDQDHQVDLALKELEDAQRLADKYYAEYQREAGDPYAADRYKDRMIAVRRRVDSAKARLKSVGYQQDHEREYNHADEIDADLKGLELTARAGYDPDGLDKALGKLEKYGVQRFGDAALQGGQTHPPVEKRRAILRKVQASWRAR